MTGAGSGGQGPPDGSDTEDAEKCPVCLGVPAAGELAMPDSCCHVFCLRCLLTWAEMSPSCPVDRRPFSSIYSLDSSLRLVQVPVRRRSTPTEAESCSCRNPEQKACLKSKPARRSRRQKTERTADNKMRGLVRKCNDDDPSSLSRKKVKASECCTWSPSTCVSVTPAQDIADPAWLAEDVPHDDTFERCKAQGVVCAVTCPKGGEKRGGRSSTSKAPTKEVTLPSRRSRRNSKLSEETPTSDSKSPTQSSLSDSDSPAGQSNKPTKPPQAPAKRKGKRITNRKAGGKRKAKRKNSSCPAASDEEEEKEEEGNGSSKNAAVEQDDETKEQDLKEQQQTDAEGDLKEEQSGFNSAGEQEGPMSLHRVEQSDEEAQGQSSEEPQGKRADDRSCNLPPHSPGVCVEGAPSDQEEEETASPRLAGEQESQKRTSHSSDSEDTPLKDSASPQSDEHTEQEDTMETCVQSRESSTEKSSKEPEVGLDKEAQSGLLTGESEENVTNNVTSKEDTLPKGGTSPNGEDVMLKDTNSNGKDAIVMGKGDISPSGGDIMGKVYVSPKECVFPKGDATHKERTALEEEGVILKGEASPSGKDVTLKGDDVPKGDISLKGDASPSGKDVTLKGDTVPKGDVSPKGEASPSGKDVPLKGDAVPKGDVSPKGEASPSGKDVMLKGDAVPKGDVSPKGEASPNQDSTLKVEVSMPQRNSAPSDNGTSKDDTNVVPMDCSSPLSEHGNNSFLNLPSVKASPAASETLATVQNTQVTKADSASERREREGSHERKNDKQRRSRFHSATSTWSPQRDSKREPARRSRSRERDGSAPSSRSSRARSRDRDRDGERDYPRRDRSRERRRRRSRSQSRSRSRSQSRTRSYWRGSSPERAPSRDQSPQRKERRCGWKTGGEGGSGHDGRRYGGSSRFENGLPPESSLDRQGWSENPDWVTEKTRADSESRSRDYSFSAGSRWEDQRRSGGEFHGRGGFERGGGSGRGGGSHNFYNQQEEPADSRWQPRNNFSGTGNDSYSRFNENRGGGRKKEFEPGECMVDRSGWSSASSWAVRRTLPADVQDYYSKRDRGPSSWSRQEEEQPPSTTDPPKSDPPPPPPPPPVQVVPVNPPVAVMNVLPPHPPQLNLLHHHQFPIQSLQGPLPVTLQPAVPFVMPSQVPVHLHRAVPLIQVPTVGAQGLPPPPPPPPPMQAGSQVAIASAQPDGYAAQMVSTVVGYGKSALLVSPAKGRVGQPVPSQALPSSTTQPSQHRTAQADSSKKEKKQQFQEKAVNEVKTAMKPFYQRKEITKEEYKEIVRKAVEKVCHSKSMEVNSSKVANLVKAYVDKYKHARKK